MAPSSPGHETPAPAQDQSDEAVATETSPLLPGRPAIPSNRLVVWSYGATQSHDIVHTASRLGALAPPPSPSLEGSSGASQPWTAETGYDASQQAQRDLNLEAGRTQQEDEKSEEIGAQPIKPGDGNSMSTSALFVLLAAFYIFMLVMALRELYDFV
ncbi:hypothetical protein LTR86_001332 [Recurvomyces mirabilis]|nr:hypothetical protein LTR86_001332 [Recurvomyces mirabilis]